MIWIVGHKCTVKFKTLKSGTDYVTETIEQNRVLLFLPFFRFQSWKVKGKKNIILYT